VTDREKLGAKIDPVLRAWADRVIIPALAREYLAREKQKGIAREQGTVAKFKIESRPSAEVTS